MECRGIVRSWYANGKVLRVSPELEDGGLANMSELYFASCAKHETSVVCPRCQRDTNHRTQVRMMTLPNVLAIHVRRQEGARVPAAVEQQLDLPGFLVMELVGVVYHNGENGCLLAKYLIVFFICLSVYFRVLSSNIFSFMLAKASLVVELFLSILKKVPIIAPNLCFSSLKLHACLPL